MSNNQVEKIRSEYNKKVSAVVFQSYYIMYFISIENIDRLKYREYKY